jgi:hypothetical protein
LLPNLPAGGDNRAMGRKARSGVRTSQSTKDAGRFQFSPGSVVVATLGNPREKFWGIILSLAPEGLSLSGAELASFEDLTTMVKDGEAVTPAVVFFPMHRIERVELDLPDGSLPSLSQRFTAKTGLEPAAILVPGEPDRPKTNDTSREPATGSRERA